MKLIFLDLLEFQNDELGTFLFICEARSAGLVAALTSQGSDLQHVTGK
jgi:hypothetical protein